MNYHSTKKSTNVKTGPMPVTTTDETSCPDTCPHLKKKTCYGKHGPISWHWKKVGNERGYSLDQLCEEITSWEDGILYRYAQVGDLPGENLTIDESAVHQLINANRPKTRKGKGKKNIAYSHKPVMLSDDVRDITLVETNQRIIRHANRNGFTINISTDGIAEFDCAKALDIGPVVISLPSDHDGKTFQTPDGHNVIVCPAQKQEGMTCLKCKLCSMPDRKCGIGFIGHGAKASLIELQS